MAENYRITGGWKLDDGKGLRFPINERTIQNILGAIEEITDVVLSPEMASKLIARLSGSTLFVFRNSYAKTDSDPAVNAVLVPPREHNQGGRRPQPKGNDRQQNNRYRDDDIPF